MNRVGGSVFVRNAIKYDYCITESINSLLAACDEVVVLDASSDDGTTHMLEEMQLEKNNFTLITGAKWECEREGFAGSDRLVQLANLAKSYLKHCDWHFMLQADEVVHHTSVEAIRSAIEVYGNDFDSFLSTRVNSYGDLDHYVSFDCPSKPCSDRVVRLGRPTLNAYGDAESIEGGKRCDSYADNIIIFHYGFVRNPNVLVDKVIDMQTWFGLGIDKRVLKMKEEGRPFDGREVRDEKWLAKLWWEHPTFALRWVEERRQFFNK